MARIGYLFAQGAFARLRDDATVQQAQAEIDLICARLAEQYPMTNKGMTAEVIPLQEKVVANIRPDLQIEAAARREAEENDLAVRNDQFLALGLQPTTLSEGLMEEITDIASRYKDRVDPSKIIARSVWRAGMETSADLMTEVPEAH